jgi:hypothetical protein
MGIRRTAVTTGIAGAFLVAAATSAVAYTKASGTFSQSTTGVQFQSASYKFLVNETYDFYYTGYLKDTAADGHSVFVHGKIDGYGYGPSLYHSGGYNTGATKSQYLYTSSTNQVGYAKVESCTDRGTLYADYCDSDSWNA